jgi:hypothetical protein
MCRRHPTEEGYLQKSRDLRSHFCNSKWVVTRNFKKVCYSASHAYHVTKLSLSGSRGVILHIITWAIFIFSRLPSSSTRISKFRVGEAF